MLTRRPTSGPHTSTEKASSGTLRPQPFGYARPLTRGIPKRSGSSAGCLKLAKVCPRTPYKPRHGIHWFSKAAEQGNAYAQANLGWLYANGLGVQQDDTQALMWSTLAVAGAEDDATRELAVKVRDALAAKMTPAQIAEAQRLARQRFPK